MPDRVTQAVREAQAILARHVEPGPLRLTLGFSYALSFRGGLVAGGAVR